jgi:hypothetical protein
MDKQPKFAIDLLKTFTQRLRKDEEPVFYMVDGTESHPSKAFWKLGKKAFSAITFDDPTTDTDDEEIQEKATAILEKWFEVVELHREYLLNELTKDDGAQMVGEESGSDISISSVQNISMGNMSRNLALWLTESPTLSKESQKFYKHSLALMTLHAMNDLRFGDHAFLDSPSWAVEIYENTRDMWDHATHFESALASIKYLTRNAALARHRENYELKQEALNYYAENKSRFRSRAAAAAEINKLLPIRERTIYKWLTEADKE